MKNNLSFLILFIFINSVFFGDEDLDSNMKKDDLKNYISDSDGMKLQLSFCKEKGNYSLVLENCSGKEISFLDGFSNDEKYEKIPYDIRIKIRDGFSVLGEEKFKGAYFFGWNPHIRPSNIRLPEEVLNSLRANEMISRTFKIEDLFDGGYIVDINEDQVLADSKYEFQIIAVVTLYPDFKHIIVSSDWFRWAVRSGDIGNSLSWGN